MARNPLTVLVFYSIGMIILPIAAYFVSRHVLESIINRQSANVYSAISSVVVIHIILFCFVYKAYTEDKHLTKEPIKPMEKTD